jgi:predicted RND superfamily exporter protein
VIEKYVNWVMRWRWLIILVSLAIVVVLASGARFLKFDNDYRAFFDGDNPQLVAFENLQSTYTKNDNVLMLLAPRDGKVFTQSTLKAVVDITERAWQTPFSLRVDSISNYQHTYAEGDDLTVIDLIEDPESLTPAQLENIKSIAVNEPLLKHRLVSPQAHVTAINITVELPGKDLTAEVPKVVKSVRALEDYIHKTYPDIDVYLSGVVMLNNAFPEASQHDMQNLIPLAFAAILIMVLLLLRGVSGTLATFIVILLSIVTAMGTAGWMGIRLTPPMMSVPVIVLTLAVADCVHILSNWMQEMRTGKDKKSAMIESLRINFTPVFLTSVTTAIGFMSLNFSDAPPFRDLGNTAAIGVLAAWVLSVAFLPALVTLLPSRVRAKQDKTSKSMLKFADFVIARRNALLWGMLLLIILLSILIPRNQLNDIYIEYFDERIQFRTDTDFIVNNLTGVYFVDFSLDSKQSEAVSRPEFQNQVEKFATWLREQPEVIHVNTITDIMKRLNRNMHSDTNDWYKLPEKRDLAAQYLLLYEMSLPYGLDLNNQIDIRKQSTRLSATLKTISTQQVLALEQRIQDWMRQNTPEIQTWGSSPTVMFSHIGIKNIRSMLIGTVIALLLISLILIIALRSVRYGLISLVPNLVPAAMAFGLWSIINGQIGLSLSVVTAMTLGIVVDDTVHFLSKYLRARREQGLDAEAAVRYAFSTVGVALWVTSAALIAGFLVLSTSSFELNSGMGLLTAIVIAFALLADFLFLPPLLIKMDQWLGHTENTAEIPKPVTA